jgi:hydroxymethylpyrimidine pyrophosphatase-like HAD family hydrolase
VVSVNRAGLQVVIVSGRSRIQLLEVARLCGWNDFIAEAGAVRSHWTGSTREMVYDPGLWPEGLPAAGRPVIEEIVASGAYEALRDAFPGRIEYHDPWHLNRDASHVLRGCVAMSEAQAVLDTLRLPMGFVDNGVVRRQTPTLACEGMPVHAYHIVPKGVSKRRAIELDLAARGLGPSDAVMIGDSFSDLECAPTVGVALLVRNALDSASVTAELPAHPNAVVTRALRGDGWAEFARTWLAARG